MGAVAIDGQARVALAHACVQAIAAQHGIDLLHVKGPALDPSLRGAERISSDADVLVRPDRVRDLMRALADHGWVLVTGFSGGSAFEHAANYHHVSWGYVDVHRSFPGISVPSGQAFATLWSGRLPRSLAHVGCSVPALTDQALLLCLHAARGFGSPRAAADLERAWYAADDGRRASLRVRATELGAEVALAAAIGELDQHRADRTADLWRFYSEGGTRVDEWLARLRAAPDRRTALRTAVRGLGVNREYAAMSLGHQPSRAELTRMLLQRYGTGLLQAGRRLRRGDSHPGGHRPGRSHDERPGD